GAISLAMVFARLCGWFPRTGGPHVYALEAFGPVTGFFTGWTYWVVSWASTTAVIVATVAYAEPLTGPLSPNSALGLQILILVAVTWLNCLGVYAAGGAEFILTLLKFIPLFALPILGLMYFNADHIQISPETASLPVLNRLSHVVLLTLFGFIGLESGTTPAGSVENPSKTIPKAIILGTLTVACVYLLNSIGVIGAIPSAELAQSKAPYVDLTQRLLGGQWHILIALIASILCLGTLNAWTLSTGQIALGLADDKLLPGFFGKTNKSKAPYVALILSALGILPLLLLTTHSNMAEQITLIIDFSVTAFLFVYLVNCLAFFKILIIHKDRSVWDLLYGIVALSFCLWILSETEWQTLAIAFVFVLTGLPIFITKRSR
ncbi:MAG: amino acid permease, partial [Deltaproteobacteria bacterium]|nr:amino acid permease [Deltaproteobacteria bacterium]